MYPIQNQALKYTIPQNPCCFWAHLWQIITRSIIPDYIPYQALSYTSTGGTLKTAGMRTVCSEMRCVWKATTNWSTTTTLSQTSLQEHQRDKSTWSSSPQVKFSALFTHPHVSSNYYEFTFLWNTKSEFLENVLARKPPKSTIKVPLKWLIWCFFGMFIWDHEKYLMKHFDQPLVAINPINPTPCNWILNYMASQTKKSKSFYQSRFLSF